ncbi:MAG: hypothetical protein KDG49_22200 [Geminicoccaceae bacterium]|nr:hypothetical protein [Geminicoccaceae bacterium]
MVGKARKPLFGRSLGDEATFAVDDIRHKLVEEAWFGQAATPYSPAPDDTYEAFLGIDADSATERETAAPYAPDRMAEEPATLEAFYGLDQERPAQKHGTPEVEAPAHEAPSRDLDHDIE